MFSDLKLQNHGRGRHIFKEGISNLLCLSFLSTELIWYNWNFTFHLFEIYNADGKIDLFTQYSIVLQRCILQDDQKKFNLVVS